VCWVDGGWPPGNHHTQASCLSINYSSRAIGFDVRAGTDILLATSWRRLLQPELISHE
jgi:hypothetical protein